VVEQRKKTRFWEIDTLRGIAIIMMVEYHIFFDLVFFSIYPFNLHVLPVKIFLYSIGTIFLLLVGISLTINRSKARFQMTRKEIHIKFILRGLKIFCLGLLITVATWLYIGEGYIIFGILHCIGLCIILSIPFLRYRLLPLAIGIIMIVVGIMFSMITIDVPWLLWIGLKPTQFYTLDYFPLLPWLGVVLIGVYFGNLLYPDGERRYHLPDLSSQYGIRFLGFLGRHSLIIYLVHQPIIVGILTLLMM